MPRLYKNTFLASYGKRTRVLWRIRPQKTLKVVQNLKKQTLFSGPLATFQFGNYLAVNPHSHVSIKPRQF